MLEERIRLEQRDEAEQVLLETRESGTELGIFGGGGRRTVPNDELVISAQASTADKRRKTKRGHEERQQRPDGPHVVSVTAPSSSNPRPYIRAINTITHPAS